MFARKEREETALDKVINENLRWLDPNSDDYMQSIEALERLYKLKQQETAMSKISPDTAAMIAGNIVGILLIIHYERANILASKALSFVLKLR